MLHHRAVERGEAMRLTVVGFLVIAGAVGVLLFVASQLLQDADRKGDGDK